MTDDLPGALESTLSAAHNLNILSLSEQKTEERLCGNENRALV